MVVSPEFCLFTEGVGILLNLIVESSCVSLIGIILVAADNLTPLIN